MSINKLEEPAAGSLYLLTTATREYLLWVRDGGVLDLETDTECMRRGIKILSPIETGKPVQFIQDGRPPQSTETIRSIEAY